MKQPNTTSFAHGVIVDADGAITLGHNVSLDDDAQFHSRSLLTIAQDVVISSSNHSINRPDMFDVIDNIIDCFHYIFY